MKTCERINAMRRAILFNLGLLLAAIVARDFDEADDAADDATLRDNSGLNRQDSSDVGTRQELSPEQTLDAMQRFEKEGDYKSLLACLTQRGKGSLIYVAYMDLFGELLWRSNVGADLAPPSDAIEAAVAGHIYQDMDGRFPIGDDPAGQPYRKLLERLDLMELPFSCKLWHGLGWNLDQTYHRLADYVGDCDVEFLSENRRLRGKDAVSFFGAYQVLRAKDDADRQILSVTFESGPFAKEQDAKKGRPVVKASEPSYVEFIHVGDRWLCNGVFDDKPPRRAREDDSLREMRTSGNDGDSATEVDEATLDTEGRTSESSRERLIRDMARFERARDYKALLRCMTKRLQGEFYAELCVMLLVCGYEDDHVQKFEPCRALLNKYRLREHEFLRQESSEAATEESYHRLANDTFERLANRMGDDGPIFVTQVFQLEMGKELVRSDPSTIPSTENRRFDVELTQEDGVWKLDRKTSNAEPIDADDAVP